MSDAEGIIRELFELASEDAGLTPYTEAHLYTIHAQPHDRSATWAMHVEPGAWAGRDERLPLRPEQLAHANLPESRNAHRIVIYDRLAPELALALMRYCLELSRQYKFDPEIWKLGILVRDALGLDYADAGPGSASVHANLPNTADAAAAASLLVRGRFGPQPDALLSGTHGPLFRACEPPGDLATLGLRLVAFAALHADAFERHCDLLGTSVGRALSPVWPAAPLAWSKVTTHPQVLAAQRQIRAAVPSPEAIRQAEPMPARAWDELIEVLLDAEPRTTALLMA